MRVILRQAEAAECGLACLAMASAALGAQIELAELRRKFPVSPRGLTLLQLMDIAAAMDMSARAIRCELDELKDLQLPAVLHFGLNHFVLLTRVSGRGLKILDPARGERTLSWKEADTKFTGAALELQRTPSFRKRKEKSPLGLMSLVRFTPLIRGGLLQVLLLSLILQVYVVASPMYMRLAIDEAALKGDQGLLMALAIGFGAFALFNVLADILRSLALQKISALMSWDMTGRVFHHMLRLPLPWFQRRRLADTLTRFDSIEPVRALFANGLITSLVDGVLAIVTLAMMLIFAWKLAAVAVAGLCAYIVIRLIMVPATLQLAADSLVASIAEQGKRIETLRAIQTIKVMGAESRRESDWSNRFAETIRTGQLSATANLGFTSLQTAFDAVANVVIIFLGASAVINNELTVGTLYAFMAYRTQFMSRAQGLFELFVNWRLLDLHSDRLADIALTPTETGIHDSGETVREMLGGIRIRGLGFRYAPQDPWVLQNLSLDIDPGEFVAITGPSGCGKSTLMKLIAGLYPPTTGEIQIDGLSLQAWGPRVVRRNLGVVLQDDELISGTIAENVAFFAEDIDMDEVWKCLELASMADDVRAMAMRAETFVGDMGAALSGGQKQRLLVARALYRQPRILMLDEATSHLDLTRERIINNGLKAQPITRIVIAHRPETIAAADRILVMQDGMLKPVHRAPGIASVA